MTWPELSLGLGEASTKGCSRESSDRKPSSTAQARSPGLNEGLLSREQRHGDIAASLDRGRVASTKGCSRESSDHHRNPPETMAIHIGLNEGLLSREQRPTDAPGNPDVGSLASTKGCSRESSDPRQRPGTASHRAGLNEGLLSREQRPAGAWVGRAHPARPQRRAALARAATSRLVGRVEAMNRLNEGLLSREQRRSTH